MTEKRFTIIDGVKKGTHSGIWDNQKQNNQRIGDELWLGEVVAMLNEGVMIAKENEQLKLDNKRLLSDYTDVCNDNIAVGNENEQLKQRNNRQYEQLNKLWKLIEKGDWETLTAMDKKMKEDEERLQKEWGTYSD